VIAEGCAAVIFRIPIVPTARPGHDRAVGSSHVVTDRERVDPFSTSASRPRRRARYRRSGPAARRNASRRA
jgi:hypothetical protein